jgi:hypothetical protein
MSKCDWLRVGGWVRIDSATPCEAVLEVVQHVFDNIPSQPAMMSLQGGPWPAGVWHWEPEGWPSSVEPTHYRRHARAAVAASLAQRIAADA